MGDRMEAETDKGAVAAHGAPEAFNPCPCVQKGTVSRVGIAAMVGDSGGACGWARVRVR